MKGWSAMTGTYCSCTAHPLDFSAGQTRTPVTSFATTALQVLS